MERLLPVQLQLLVPMDIFATLRTRIQVVIRFSHVHLGHILTLLTRIVLVPKPKLVLLAQRATIAGCATLVKTAEPTFTHRS